MEASCATLMTPASREALGGCRLLELKMDWSEGLARVPKPMAAAWANPELLAKSTELRRSRVPVQPLRAHPAGPAPSPIVRLLMAPVRAPDGAKSDSLTGDEPEAAMADTRRLRVGRRLPPPYRPRPNRPGSAALLPGAIALKLLTCPKVGAAAPDTTVSSTSVP